MNRDVILKAIQKVTGEEDFQLDTSEVGSHGDYATNVAMQMFDRTGSKKILRQAQDDKVDEKIISTLSNVKSQRELAKKIVYNLSKDKELLKIVSKIEVAGPGFINFWLTRTIFVNEIGKVIDEKDKYGSSNSGKGKTVVIDYSAPNIAKRFSVGHLRSTIIGQALYNFYKHLGYKTIGDNHLGDWGTQFGMIIAQVIRKDLDVSNLTLDEIEKLYIEFNSEAKENPELKKQGSLWFKKLEEGDSQARKIWQECVELSLKEFQKIWDKLDVNIDYAYGESFYENKMQVVIEEFRKNGLSKKSEGAEIIKFDNLPPAILVKSDGGTTYFTRDLATIKFRIDTWEPTFIIYEVGAEQTLHFRQVFEAARLIGWNSKIHYVHVPHGLFLLEGKKMSTRKGTTIKLEEVLDGAVDRAKSLLEKSETSGEIKAEEKDQIAEDVGIGAVRYFDLMHHPTSEINFSWDSIFNMQGNSGPYLQYTYARTQSVLNKAAKLDLETSKDRHSEFNSKPILKRVQDDVNLSFKNDAGQLHEGVKLNNEELSVLRTFPHFSEVIVGAAKNYSPNLLCNYLFDLAQKFNSFYAKHKILSTDDSLQSTENIRLALTAATGQILKNGLTLLGIETPEKM